MRLIFLPPVQIFSNAGRDKSTALPIAICGFHLAAAEVNELFMKQLNEYEKALIHNAEVIRTKNTILKKATSIFASISEHYTHLLESYTASEVTRISPKISRGEKYQDLPYLVLDYPRIFSSAGIVAIRSFFWWGHYFSITLHLQGTYLQFHLPRLQELVAEGFYPDFLIQTTGDMWQHELGDDYHPLSTTQLAIDDQLEFVKIAKKIPLHEWDDIEKIMLVEFEKLAQVFYAPIR